MKELLDSIKEKLRKLGGRNIEIILLSLVIAFACLAYFFDNKPPIESNAVIFFSFLWFFLFPARNIYKRFKDKQEKERQQNEKQ